MNLIKEYKKFRYLIEQKKFILVKKYCNHKHMILLNVNYVCIPTFFPFITFFLFYFSVKLFLFFTIMQY